MKVALYARFSTDKQNPKSCDDQLAKCATYATQRGWAVVERFTDAALSGATMMRPGLQALLAQARMKGERFSAVLIDDASRLSREQVEFQSLVFQELLPAGVVVVDCATGMMSDAPRAHMLFGMMAITNHAQLETTRQQTLRGLGARFDAGFHTGGRVYGYESLVDPAAVDPLRAPKRLVVYEPEAAVVRRVFDMFNGGFGLKKIATQLNNEGVAAPDDDAKNKKRSGMGWGHSTIRAMLKNPRYRGQIRWGARRWTRRPGNKSRTPVERPEHELKCRHESALEIVTDEVWAAAQARFSARRERHGGRAPGDATHAHLLGGLLRCGTCGAPMTITSSKTKNGVRYANFKCAANNTKGAAICANALSVSEMKVNDAIAGAIRDLLTQPGLAERFLTRLQQRIAALQLSESDGASFAALDKQVSSSELAVRNLTKAIARATGSFEATMEPLMMQLQAEQEKLRALRGQRDRVASPTKAAVVPMPGVLRAYLDDMASTLGGDARAANALLKQHVGEIRLSPEGEGPSRRYVATGAFGLSVPVETGRSAKGPSCGGAQAPFPETWIPLEAELRRRHGTEAA